MPEKMGVNRGERAGPMQGTHHLFTRPRARVGEATCSDSVTLSGGVQVQDVTTTEIATLHAHTMAQLGLTAVGARLDGVVDPQSQMRTAHITARLGSFLLRNSHGTLLQ